jgi:tyrosine-protein kinase Etk/Wzc
MNDHETKGPQAGVTAAPDKVNPFVIVKLLLAAKGKILAIAVLVFLLGTAIAFVLPVQYTATASLVPPGTNTGSSAAALMGQLSAMSGGAMINPLKNPSDLYVGILKSRTIAAEIVRRFNLTAEYKVKKESQAEKLLGTHSDISVGLKDSIITIKVSDHSPERARDLAQGYLDALRDTTGGLALTESSQRRQFYEQRLSQEKNDLADAEVALKENQEKTGMIAPAGQTAAEIQAIAQLRAQIAGRQVRLASLRENETDQNPDVVRIRSEIGDLEAQVAKMENGSGKGGYGNMSAAQVPAAELEYIRRAREVKYHEALFDIISKQYEAARLDEAHETPLQVLDRPSVPDTKSGPPRMFIMAASLLLGLAGGIGLVLFKAWRRAAGWA